MSIQQRIQQAVERIQTDQRMRGDLEDQPARALVEWAVAQATAIASDLQRSDDEVEAQLKSLRSAAYNAARIGASAADQVVAAAERTFRNAGPH
jgi:hypothetical protein